MSRLGKIFMEAAKYPESWKAESYDHFRHLPTRTTLHTPGLFKLRTYDGEVWLDFWKSMVIRFRLWGWKKKIKKQRYKQKESEEYTRISNAMLGIEK